MLNLQIFEGQRYCGISRYCVELARALNWSTGFSSRIVPQLHQNEYLRRSAQPGPHCFAFSSFRGTAGRTP